jgi:hypothetical protein
LLLGRIWVASRPAEPIYLCADAKRLQHHIRSRTERVNPPAARGQRTGQIKSFLFPYLGQLHRQLPNPPADLVRREEAHAYPTDFNPMSEEWIDRLSLRGEQLTLCLARAYVPHLINEASSGV